MLVSWVSCRFQHSWLFSNNGRDLPGSEVSLWEFGLFVATATAPLWSLILWVYYNFLLTHQSLACFCTLPPDIQPGVWNGAQWRTLEWMSQHLEERSSQWHRLGSPCQYPRKGTWPSALSSLREHFSPLCLILPTSNQVLNASKCPCNRNPNVGLGVSLKRPRSCCFYREHVLEIAEVCPTHFPCWYTALHWDMERRPSWFSSCVDFRFILFHILK